MANRFTPEQQKGLLAVFELLSELTRGNRLKGDQCEKRIVALVEVLVQRRVLTLEEFEERLKEVEARVAVDRATDPRIQEQDQEIRRLLGGWNPLTD